MAKRRRVIRYLPAAQNDLQEILHYIQRDKPKAAADWVEKIDREISKLGEFPELGKVPRDIRLKKLGYRILVIQNYLVFYVVLPGLIQIRRVIHGARRYEFLL